MTEQYANNAQSSISNVGGINSTALGVTLPSGEGARFPTTGEFRLVIENEIILCRSRSGDVCSWNLSDRGYENTTPASHAQGVAVKHELTAGSLRLIPDYAKSGFSGGHGLSDHVGSIFPTANQQLRGDLDADTVDLRNLGAATRLLLVNAKTLRTEYVAAATPTGGTSGDLKVGANLVWFRDNSGWHSIASSAASAVGSADHSLRFNGDTNVLRWVNLRTGAQITDSTILGTRTAVAQALLKYLQTIGPSGTGGLGTPGGHVEWVNEGTNNTQLVFEDVVGRPEQGTGDINIGVNNKALTVQSGNLLDSSFVGRMITVHNAKSGSKDLTTKIDAVSAGGFGSQVITLHDAATASVTGQIWGLSMWTGVRMTGRGLGNYGQGNGKPDAGGLVFQASSTSGNFIRGDAKAVFDFREAGFGAENLVFEHMTADANHTADFAWVGFGSGTGNACHMMDCKGIGANFACKGIGSWVESQTFNGGNFTGSGDVFYADCQWANPNTGGKQTTTGQMNTGTSTLIDTAHPFATTDIGKIVCIYGAVSGNHVLVTRITGFTDDNHVTVANAATRNTGAGTKWFIIGGVALFVGVGDIMLSNFNCASGGDYSVVIACGGVARFTFPCHIGGSTVGPDMIIFDVSQGDFKAYFDNIGVSGTQYTAGQVGGVTVMPSSGSAVTICNIGGRFNHNSSDTPSVVCDAGGGVAVQGAITVEDAMSNGYSSGGGVKSIVSFVGSWGTNAPVLIGKGIRYVKTAKLYDNDGTNSTVPYEIADDVVCASGGTASQGLQCQKFNVTVNPSGATPGQGTFTHALRGAANHAQLDVSGATPAVGHLSFTCTSTTFTVVDGNTSERDIVVSVTARVLTG